MQELRAAFPDYAAIHSHVLQDVLARLDRTYHAFFRRLQRGEKAGFPRFKPATRDHSFTCKAYGNGARLDNGFLVLAKIGRIGAHWGALGCIGVHWGALEPSAGGHAQDRHDLP
ncbi:MAG TPA: hypothetical protein VGS80_13005 [Ktedonobacterales bacterium]|nr:hypothetical protein [Ktedonobacterales bacterium]